MTRGEQRLSIAGPSGALELALEGLYLARKIGKDADAGETVYG